MKKLTVIISIVLVAMVFFVGCAKKEDSTAAMEPRVIKVSTKFVDNEQTAKSLVKMVEKINERSKGSLELQLFTAGTLPIGKDGMEQIVTGSEWMLIDGINFLGDYVPDYNAITGPMLYQSFDEYLMMTKTPLVQNLNKIAETHGIKVLSLDWVFGFRSMMTKKPIRTPADMRGVKLRVPTSQLYTFTIEALGGNPVAMPYPDTYGAIQQGVIDGVEGSILTYYGTKQYENVKEYSLTRHLLGVSMISMSTEVWASLTDEQRTIIEEEIAAGTADNLSETIKLEKEYEEELKTFGVNFHEVDGDAFNKAASPVFSKFPKWTPGIYEDIMVELNKIKAELAK